MTEHQPMTDLDAIEAYLAAASPGPWDHGWEDGSGRDEGQHYIVATAEEDARGLQAIIVMGGDNDGCSCGVNHLVDVEFIIKARRDLPALVREVRALRTALRLSWGQYDTGFVFGVQVRGLPALDRTPQQVAHELATLWRPALRERFGPLCDVRVDEDGRARAAALLPKDVKG
jgi:hypothetical protein